MASASAARPLLTLCKSQHYTILALLHRLTGPEEPRLERGKRLQIIQNLRQKLSRHLQLMRHGFYPPLRQQAEGNQPLQLQIKRFEEATAKLIPQATQFLHQAERHPGQSCQGRAIEMYQKLQAHFDMEQKHLHTLYSRHVPITLEQKQLQIFRKRLMATVSRDTSVPVPIAQKPPVRRTTSAPLPIPPRPSVQELDREAITRPVFPGETLWPTVTPSDQMKLATT